MELILALLVGGGCVAFGRWAIRRHRVRSGALPIPASAEHAPERGFEQLQPGDVLCHGVVDYLVTGVAQLREGEQHWLECRLEDAGREAWVVVDRRDPDGVLLGEQVSDLAVRGDQPSESLDHRGALLRLSGHGRARVEVQGDLAQVLTAGESRFWNYECAGSPRVWLRQVDGRWTFFAGERVRRHLVGFLPGS